MIGAFQKRELRHRHVQRRPYEDRGRKQPAKESTPKETIPADILISDFRTVRKQISIRSHSIWLILLQQPQWFPSLLSFTAHPLNVDISQRSVSTSIFMLSFIILYISTHSIITSMTMNVGFSRLNYMTWPLFQVKVIGYFPAAPHLHVPCFLHTST